MARVKMYRIELGLDDFYETEKNYYFDYKTKIEECYQKIKNIINSITSRRKVAEIEAGEFVRNFPSVESLSY